MDEGHFLYGAYFHGLSWNFSLEIDLHRLADPKTEKYLVLHCGYKIITPIILENCSIV